LYKDAKAPASSFTLLVTSSPAREDLAALEPPSRW
jgi:hypothetical protein